MHAITHAHTIHTHPHTYRLEKIDRNIGPIHTKSCLPFLYHFGTWEDISIMGRSDLNPKHYCHTLTNEIHEGSNVLFYVYKANPSNIGFTKFTWTFYGPPSFYFILEFSK